MNSVQWNTQTDTHTHTHIQFYIYIDIQSTNNSLDRHIHTDKHTNTRLIKYIDYIKTIFLFFLFGFDKKEQYIFYIKEFLNNDYNINNNNNRTISIIAIYTNNNNLYSPIYCQFRYKTQRE